MSAQQQHTTWTAYLSDSAGTVPVGTCLVLDAAGTRYIVSTAANRTATGRLSAGIALSAGDSSNPAVEVQFVGVVPPSISGLTAGTATSIRVSSAGVLERGSTGDVVGRCDADGTAYILFAGIGGGSGGGGSVSLPGNANDLIESDGAGGALALTSGAEGDVLRIVGGVPAYDAAVEVAGNVGDVQVHAIGGTLGAVAPGTSGNVLTSTGTTWVSSPATGGGGSGETSFLFTTSGDNGDEIAYSIDPSSLADGIYEITMRIRGNAGDDGSVGNFLAIGRRAWVAVSSGAILSIDPSTNEVLYTRVGPDDFEPSTATAKIVKTSTTSIDFKVRGEDGSIIDWKGEVDVRLGLSLSFGGGWAGSSGSTYNPAVLSLTGWWRDMGASPWTGVASAGTSGSNGATEATNPPSAGSALNGHVTADFDGTNDHINFAGTEDTYLNNTDGSGWVLFNADAASADAGAGNRANNPQFFADNNGVMGVGFSSAGIHLFVVDGSNGTTEKVIACSTGGWHLLQFKFHYPTLDMRLRLDNGSWQQTTAGFGTGLATTLSGNTCAGGGKLGTSSPFFNGRIAEMGISDTFISDTDFDNIRTYINARYSLAI